MKISAFTRDGMPISAPLELPGPLPIGYTIRVEDLDAKKRGFIVREAPNGKIIKDFRTYRDYRVVSGNWNSLQDPDIALSLLVEEVLPEKVQSE